jgi:K+-sensing histidine kinase KdpD
MSTILEDGASALDRALQRALQRELQAAEGAARLLLAKLERSASDEQERGELRYTRRILSRLQEIAELTAQLELSARIAEPKLESLSVGGWVWPAVEQARGQLAPELREDLGFTIDLAEKDTRIGGDLELLTRALRELLIEAARTAGESGRVRLRGRRQEEAFFHVSLTVQNQSGARLPPLGAERAELCFARARAILEAHGGSAALGSDEYGRPEVRLRLPSGEREGALR